MGCCTSLLYGLAGASKNTVKCVLTSDYQLGNWLVMRVRPVYSQVNDCWPYPWMTATDRLRLWRRARNGHDRPICSRQTPERLIGLRPTQRSLAQMADQLSIRVSSLCLPWRRA